MPEHPAILLVVGKALQHSLDESRRRFVPIQQQVVYVAATIVNVLPAIRFGNAVLVIRRELIPLIVFHATSDFKIPARQLFRQGGISGLRDETVLQPDVQILVRPHKRGNRWQDIFHEVVEPNGQQLPDVQWVRCVSFAHLKRVGRIQIVGEIYQLLIGNGYYRIVDEVNKVGMRKTGAALDIAVKRRQKDIDNLPQDSCFKVSGVLQIV